VQKSAFRDILRTVEEHLPLEHKLKFNKRIITFNSWTRLKRLNAMREILGQGLHVHFEDNDLLSDIFALDEEPGGMSTTDVQWREVVDKGSELAKGRTQKLAKDRAMRMRQLDSVDNEAGMDNGNEDDW